MSKADKIVEADLTLQREWERLTVLMLRKGFSAGAMRDYIKAEIDKHCVLLKSGNEI